MTTQSKQVSSVLEVRVSTEQHPLLGHTAGVSFRRHGIGNETALNFSFNGDHAVLTSVTGEDTIEALAEACEFAASHLRAQLKEWRKARK